MGNQLPRAVLGVAFAASLCFGAAPGDAHSVGSKTCALCHKAIAAQQEQSAMAATWQGQFPPWLPPSLKASIADDLAYQLKSLPGGLVFSVQSPGRPKLSLPVQVSMGGKRHGLGFLLSVSEVDGLPLERPAMIQARYAWSPESGKLLLAPGCDSARPQSLETSLGLVLSPSFQSRCLQCHGQPQERTARADRGVHCESCHGPGSQHLSSLGHGRPTEGIVNPKRLPPEGSIEICAQCHVGLAKFSDPSPNDLLIANQVRAIRSSECFLQSGKAFSCVACHDPHGDAANDDKRSLNACLGCHTTAAKPHAAICPVNAKSDCIGCHMPGVEMGPLHLVDHLIRVHPEQKFVGVTRRPELQSQIVPSSQYLRLFSASSAEAAHAVRRRILSGESFYTLARDSSVDSTAPIGGYLGRKNLSDLGSALAAAAGRLHYGDISDVVQSGDRWIILQRLPRDFRFDAEELEREAEDLAQRGDAAGAIGKAQQALMIYPHFLKALNFIGVTFAQNGNPKKGTDVLRVAERLYPDDARIEFTLASILDATGDTSRARVAYKRVLALDSDVVEAYANLGMTSYAAGEWKAAIETFRQGLQIDPMRAGLYYDLSLALTRTGDASGASQAMALAGTLDPRLLSAHSDSAERQHQTGLF